MSLPTRPHLPVFARAAGLGACAMLAVCAAAARAASPPPPSPPLPPAPPAIHAGTGTFSSRLSPLKDDVIARAYEAGLRMRFANRPTADADLQAALAAAATAPWLAYPNADFEDGEFAGTWTFIRAQDDGLPTRAWRDIDRSGVDGYAAERIGYCRDSREACAAWFDAGRDRAPPPWSSAGRRAYAEWTNRVMEEPCRPEADHRPSLASLETRMARSGIEKANVSLLLLLNPCGEVRDLSVEASSGNRDIDRAAVQWARGARFPSVLQSLGSLGRRGTLGRLPFSFSVDP